MPTSLAEGKGLIRDYLRACYPKGGRVLDVGPGCGTYSDILKPEGFVLDAIEIFEPYVERFSLRSKYVNVMVGDVLAWLWCSLPKYDVILFGDILEHLHASDGVRVVDRAAGLSKRQIYSLPYCYSQGPIDDNAAETHLQPDLSPEVISLRYPRLRALYEGKALGVYENTSAGPLPPVSIVACTFGRSAPLGELLECYRRCSYPGEIELVVLNDWDKQILCGPSWPGKPVRFINVKPRFNTLGEKRNYLIEQARHDLILTVDDDDLFMPWYPEEMVRGYTGRPVWAPRYVYGEGRKDTMSMRHDRGPFFPTFVMSKQQFNEIGRYPLINMMEDHAVIKNAQEKYGCFPKMNPKRIVSGYVYRWANDVHHVSGAGHATAGYEDALRTANDRLAKGEEPGGLVHVKPRWEHEYCPAFAHAIASDGRPPTEDEISHFSGVWLVTAGGYKSTWSVRSNGELNNSEGNLGYWFVEDSRYFAQWDNNNVDTLSATVEGFTGMGVAGALTLRRGRAQ